MKHYFRKATKAEKKEDGLDYRLTPEGEIAYEKYCSNFNSGQIKSLTMFLVETVYELQGGKI